MEPEKKSQANKPLIWVVGNSVLMDGIVACLAERQGTNLVRWDALKTDLYTSLQAKKPTLIIFELDTPGSFMLLDLLREHPGIHLLGINRNANQVIVLNSFARKTRAMIDLYQLVEEVVGGGDWPLKGGSLLARENNENQLDPSKN